MTEGLDSSREERFNQVVAEYLEADKLGRPPERESLLQEFPELADDLREFFADHDRMNKFAEPQRPAHRASAPREPVAPTLNATTPADQAGTEQIAATFPNDARSEATNRRYGAPPVGTRVRYFDDYELLEEVARGGMGVVYKARQVKLNRVVALKMILTGQFASREDVRRFYTEAEAAANLDHPGIVPVFEVGEFEGQHYLSMGFVDGESLASKLIDGPLPPRESAELVQTVAQAVQFAHKNGVIHRDLKPSNILLDDQRHPRITDFGLAKRVRADSHVTDTGEILGTPSFMPPEQAAGRLDQVRETADVYALGAVLYTSLTGHPPFHADNPLDTLLQVMEREPISPRELNQNVPRDLETICLKCLEKDRRRRYRCASDLAKELERYLDGRPIQARPIGRAARGWRWCRRNPAVAVLGGSALTLLIAVAVVATAAYFREATLRGVADEALRNESNALDRAEQARDQAKTALKRETTALARERDAKKQTEIQLAESFLHQGRRYCETGEISHGLLWLARALQTLPGDEAALEQVIRLNIASWRSQVRIRLRLLIPQEAPASVAAFSPDGKTFVTGGLDETAQIWDSVTGEPIGPPLRHEREVTSVAFSPDGRKIVTTSKDRTARLWDAATAAPIGEPLWHPDVVWDVAFSPDGRTLLIGCNDGTARFWDVETRQTIGEPLMHPEQPQTMRGAGVVATAFSPNGNAVLTGSNNWTAQLWDANTHQPIGKPLRHERRVTGVAFSSNGSTVLTGSMDKTTRFWDAATGKPIGKPLRLQHFINNVAFTPDGERFLTATDDGVVRLWDTATRAPVSRPLPHRFGLTAVAFSPDGKTLLTGGLATRLWDLAGDTEHELILRHRSGFWSAAFSPDGKTIVAGLKSKIAFWDATTGAEIGPTLPNPGRVDTVAFSPDGRLFATGNWNGARLWDAETGRRVGEPLLHDGRVWSLAFSPDGRVLLTGCVDNTARFWDVATGKPLGRFFEHQVGAASERHGGVRSVAFSPDGRTVLTGGSDSTARLWNADLQEPINDPLKHQNWVSGVAFSPSGKIIATACLDNTARLWSVTTGKIVGPPLRHRSFVNSVAFSPDGKILNTGSRDRTAQLWDVETGKPVGRPLRHQGYVSSAAFSPDGKSVLTVGDDHTARIWKVPVPVEGDPERLILWLQVITGMQLTEGGTAEVLDAEAWSERRKRLDDLGGRPMPNQRIN